MKNILVPIGASKNAKNHLQYAIDFAEAFNAKLYVVQIYNVYTKAGTMIKVDDIIERESKAYLNRLISEVDSKNVEIISRSLKGKLIDTLELVKKAFDIDLILLEPRTNSIKDEVFLGKTSGKIIKQTHIPALIVPEKAKFAPFKKVLVALKSGVIEKENALNPLLSILNKWQNIVHLLLVKTPDFNDGDFEVDKQLDGLVTKTTNCESATTYQGVLLHQKEIDPDLLCVVRRQRGFFKKMWEKNIILKKELNSPNTPILVLSGLKGH